MNSRLAFSSPLPWSASPSQCHVYQSMSKGVVAWMIKSVFRAKAKLIQAKPSPRQAKGVNEARKARNGKKRKGNQMEWKSAMQMRVGKY